MEKKTYENKHFTLVTGETKSEIGNVYHSSTFGETFQTYAKVSLEGKEISRNNHIDVTIKQTVLTHNHFELLCPSEAFADKNNYPLTNSQKLMGKPFSVQLIRFKQTTAVLQGIITRIEYTAKDGYPYIRLIGKSATILMDQGKKCRTFINKTLQQIAQYVTDDYKDNRLDVLIAPKTQEILPYTVCYNETDFEFLKRLAVKFGEYMCHNGQYFVFGSGNQLRTDLFQGRDFQEYSLEVDSQPQHFVSQRYDLRKDALQIQDSAQLPYPDIRNQYHFKAVQASQQLFTQPQTGHHPPDLFYGDAQQLERAVERKKLSHQGTLQVMAQTDNPHLRVGDTMKMNAWNKEIQKHQPIESYRIMEIVHHYTHEGYTNRARAIPFEQRVAPYLDENAYPRIDSQFAQVVDNNDPEGLNRLKIRFFWQNSNESTLWVPLIQGHSGGGQGDHVIPEIDHIVLVDFLGQNAEAPIVLGSLYSGNQKSGFHTPENDLKVFQTRSGTKRIANDAEGSILEEDAEGSYIKLEGDGNVTLNAVKNLNVIVGENFNLSVGNNMESNIGRNYRLRIRGNANWVVTGTADCDVKGDLITHTDSDMIIHSNGKIENQSKDILLNNSQTQVKNNSGETSNLY